MIRRFDIEPYRGALPIKFGMPRHGVHQLLGTPDSSFPIWDESGHSDHYLDATLCIGSDNDGFVNHIGFGPGRFELFILDRRIWDLADQPDPNPLLLTLDPAPLEFVGFWFYLQIGVATTGYHDNDPAQFAMTVFPRGSKAAQLADAGPADTRNYTS